MKIKNNNLRPITIKRMAFIRNIPENNCMTIEETIKWFEIKHNIRIEANKVKYCDKKYHWENSINISGVKYMAMKRNMFPYRSTKYNLKNDRLEDAILSAIEYIDNKLF